MPFLSSEIKYKILCCVIKYLGRMVSSELSQQNWMLFQTIRKKNIYIYSYLTSMLECYSPSNGKKRLKKGSYSRNSKVMNFSFFFLFIILRLFRTLVLTHIPGRILKLKPWKILRIFFFFSLLFSP